MTAKELMYKFSNDFGFSKWPETYEVDAETYGYCCQAILDSELERQFPEVMSTDFRLRIAVGRRNGLMYKNVELILKPR